MATLALRAACAIATLCLACAPARKQGLPMYVHTPEATAVRRRADRLVGPLAALALSAAAIALALPVPSSGRSPGAVGASAAVLSDSQAVTTRARMSRPASADHGRVPLFFGFLEYDWDPDAPGGVSGFDSWPKHDLRVAEPNPRS